jgi:hypothetical protein
MDNYILWKYADVHLVQGEACGDGAEAVRLYAERCS